MNATNLLTEKERKAIIERLVSYAFDNGIKKDELKELRTAYNKWNDAKLLSVRFN